MACSLKDTIKEKIVKNATSYIVRENEVFITVSNRLTLTQTYNIAEKKVKEINQEYQGNIFGNPTSLNTTYTNGTGINIHITPQLQKASDIRDGKDKFERNIQFFRGDVALFEQEQRELSVEDLYEKSLELSTKEIEERIKKCK